MDGLVVTRDQPPVAGDLNEVGREPNHRHQRSARPEQRERQLRRTDPEHEHDGRQFDQHRRRHDPRRQHRMPLLVRREDRTADAAEQRVMHDLHEPDQAGHVQRRGKLPKKQPAMPGVVHRRDSNRASAARRPDIIAPLIDALSRWSPHTTIPLANRTSRRGFANAGGNCRGNANGIV